MQIPPSLRPFLHKGPIIAIVIYLVLNFVNLLGKLANVQDLVVGWSMLISIVNFFFNTKWGLFCFQFIGLFAIWLAVKKHLEVAREYDRRNEIVSVPENANLIQRNEKEKTVLTFTANALGRELSLNSDPIQSVCFIKPFEKIVRPNYLPIIIPCETNKLKRLRNWLVGFPQPRIIVNRFTDNGIVIDEKNTKDTQLIIRFYQKD